MMDQTPARRATWRLDARLRFRLQWIVIAIICLLLFVALKPTFIHIRETRDLQVCENNVRKIAGALKYYLDDWDQALPPGPTWMNNVQGYLAATSKTGFTAETYFHCPLDHTGSPSSYSYNDLLEGVSPKVASSGADEKESRRKRVRNADKIPLIFEKHGSVANAHVRLQGYQDLAAALTPVHDMPEPTGVIMRGDGGVERMTLERLAPLNGKRF